MTMTAGRWMHAASSPFEVAAMQGTELPLHSRLFIVCGRSVEEDVLKQAFLPFGNLENIKLIKEKGGGFGHLVRCDYRVSLQQVEASVPPAAANTTLSWWFSSFLAGSWLLAVAMRAHQIYCGGYPCQLLHSLAVQQRPWHHAAATTRSKSVSFSYLGAHVVDQANMVVSR
eukprot:GHRQ01022033.1.p1 GENE.GHRQ01022033.1~~GHRQ01022033.1.p1  ORF type:complete len:171 (+),score=16.47 GHRQ01022033.1:79-591(+)